MNSSGSDRAYDVLVAGDGVDGLTADTYVKKSGLRSTCPAGRARAAAVVGGVSAWTRNASMVECAADHLADLHALVFDVAAGSFVLGAAVPADRA
jgi:hypothetical protein